MHYAVNLKDMSLRASNSYPWLDFCSTYTFIHNCPLSMEDLVTRVAKEDIGTCVASNAIDYAVTILNDLLDPMKALEYEFNNALFKPYKTKALCL